MARNSLCHSMSGSQTLDHALLMPCCYDSQRVLDEDLSREESERRMDAIKLCATTLEKGFKRRLAAAQSASNANCCINKLPQELLVRIWCEVVEPLSASDYYTKGVVRLCFVCKSWNALIRNTPSLWSFISLIHPTSLIKEVVRRSRNSALTVSDLLPSYVFDKRHPKRTRFRQVSLEQVERWGSAELQVYDIEDIMPLFVTTTARLHTLELAADKSATSRRIPDGFGINKPNLQALSLTGVDLSWEATTLSRLTSLKIAGVRDCSSTPNLVRILDILHSSPDLESFTFVDNNYKDSVIPTTYPTIILPKLTKLWLKTTTITGEQLLSYVGAKSCKEVTLELATHGSSSTHGKTFPCIDQFSPLFKSALLQARQLTVELDGNRNFCRCGSISVDLRHKSSASWLFPWMLKSLFDREVAVGSGPNLNLILGSGLNFSRPTVLDHILYFLPFTTKLEVHGGKVDLRPLLQHLARPVTRDQYTSWRLPKLVTLVITGGRFDPEDLEEMVFCRYGKSAKCNQDLKEKGLVGTQRPPTLQKLELWEVPFDRGVNRSLKELIVGGNGQLLWDRDDDEDVDSDEREFYGDPYYETSDNSDDDGLGRWRP